MRNWYFTYWDEKKQEQIIDAIRTPSICRMTFSVVRDQLILPYLKSRGVIYKHLTYERAKNDSKGVVPVEASLIKKSIVVSGVWYDTAKGRVAKGQVIEKDLFIYKKEVDWSLLFYGISIPISTQVTFIDNLSSKIEKGESISIKLKIDNYEYDATVINQEFRSEKYSSHPEIIQIRYSKNSSIASYLRDVFASTLKYLTTVRASSDSKEHITVPIESKEYVALYSSEQEDTYVLDCITKKEMHEVIPIANLFSEMQLEEMLNAIDDTSGIIEKNRLQKIRKLNRAIGDNLKKLYDYRCQICGEKVFDKYGVNFIHTHHIEPFSISLNNDADNIIVLCPNHHSAIHAANPIFERNSLCFIYPNGFIDKILLNEHLKN